MGGRKDLRECNKKKNWGRGYGGGSLEVRVEHWEKDFYVVS